MQRGLVSIVMPAYNAEKWIAESINSVIAQTYQDWELLIVDDCSSDNTISEIKKFEDSRIIIVQNEINSGAAISRNYALREATGKWIAFLDCDDVWDSRKLDLQLKFMLDNDYKFSFTDYRIVYSDGAQSDYVMTAPNVINKRKMFNYCYFSTITVIYDREFVGLIQIADLKKNNDYAMWLEIIKKSNCYRFENCLSIYYKREASITSGSKIKMIKHHYIMFRKGLNKNIYIALLLTINNLFFGVMKKLFNKMNREKYKGIIVEANK